MAFSLSATRFNRVVVIDYKALQEQYESLWRHGPSWMTSEFVP
jgi:hypothetical protein